MNEKLPNQVKNWERKPINKVEKQNLLEVALIKNLGANSKRVTKSNSSIIRLKVGYKSINKKLSKTEMGDRRKKPKD